MYALSLLEEPLATEIRTHIAERCETCTAEVRTSASVWYLYGLSHVADDGVQPSRALRGRVLEIPTLGRVVAMRLRPFPWNWAPPLAAGVLIGAVSWYGWEASHRRPIAPLIVPVAPVTN